MRVWLLGGFRVSVNSGIIAEDQWRLRKAAALVKLLALAPNHRLHREQVMDLLWRVYGVKLHLLCSTNQVPLGYELTPANVAEVSLTEELLAEAKLGDGAARKLLGDLAYRSGRLKEELAASGILLATTESSARRPGARQQVEIALASLKRVFGLGETLATTLVGLATRIAANITANTYGFLRQPSVGSSSRPPQGVVGMNLATLI